jgi:hypothetical protein
VTYDASSYPCKFRGESNGSLNCGCGIGTQPTFPCSNPVIEQPNCVIQLGNKKWKYRDEYNSCSGCDFWEKPEGWVAPPKKEAKPVPPLMVKGRPVERNGDRARRGERLESGSFHRPKKGERTKSFLRPADKMVNRSRPEVEHECQNPDRPVLPFEKEPIRHLLYHMGPFSGNGVWQRNVEQLLKRIDLFNGRRIVAIVTGEGLDPPEMVMEAFKGEAEFIVKRNNPRFREVVTFKPLFSKLESLEPNEVIFYAQAKGVTRPPDDTTTVHRWTTMMYESLLDPWPSYLLERFPVVGSFKKVGQGFQGSESSWHYSGSFCWFRSCELYKRDWTRIDKKWWGIESYPSLHFSAEEAGCVFRQGTVRELDLYDYHYFHESVIPHYEQWSTNSLIA